jgi:hypothetical protein
MATTELLNKAYLAYFGRPVDFDGALAWGPASGATNAQVEAGFFAASESKSIYGDKGVNLAYINAVYQNLFNHDADVEGAAHWLNMISTGRISAAGAALEILAGAVGADKTISDNKLAATAAFSVDMFDSTAQSIGYANGLATARAFIKSINGVAATPDAIAAAVIASTSGGTPGSTFTLTTGIDSGTAFTGTANSDIFNAPDGSVIAGGNTGVALTLTALDSLDGGAGNDTLNVTNTLAITIPTSATVKNIETANITSALAVNGDVSGWTGLTKLNVVSSAAGAESITAAVTTGVTVTNSTGQNVTIVGGGLAGSVTTGAAGVITVGTAGGAGGAATANAYTSVALKGGTSSFVTDNSGTTGTVGTTLTTVTLDNTALITTIEGKGILNVTAANEAATASVVITNAATAAQTLNLTVNNNAAGFLVTDASAKTVNVIAAGTKATSVDLAIAAATTLNTSGSADLTLTTVAENYTLLTTLNIANTGKFTADLSAVSTPTAAAITSIVATTSTGTNTLAIDATKTTYAGGSGVDNITIAAAPTKAIDGGAGVADVLTVNIATAFNASANTKITGFETLGLGALAGAVAYDATGYLHLTTGSTAGTSSFTNVAAGVDLAFTAANANVITYTLANSTGLTDAMTASIALGASGANLLTATGVENITIAASNTTAATVGAVAIMDTITLSAAPTAGATTTITLTSGALTGVTLLDTTDLTISSVNASGVLGDGKGTAGTGFVWTTGILAATTATTATTITGSANGGDNINAGAAVDLITITAFKGTNTLIGSATNKSMITGGTGADAITGGSAADTIVGGGGADVIIGGAGADKITLSGATSTVNQSAVGASGANTSTTIQTAELTSTFDVIYGAAAGTKLDFLDATYVTANLTLAGTNLAGAGDKVVFARGTYDTAAATFTFAANGADTAVTYDTTVGAGEAYETIILVGAVAGTTTTAAAGIITLA